MYAGNNYYLHSDRDDRFTMLPSGLDRTFGATLEDEGADAVIAARCAAIDPCRARFLAELARVRESAAPLSALARRLDRSLIAPAAADPRSPHDAPAREAAVAELLLHLDGL